MKMIQLVRNVPVKLSFILLPEITLFFQGHTNILLFKDPDFSKDLQISWVFC